MKGGGRRQKSLISNCKSINIKLLSNVHYIFSASQAIACYILKHAYPFFSDRYMTVN